MVPIISLMSDGTLLQNECSRANQQGDQQMLNILARQIWLPSALSINLRCVRRGTTHICNGDGTSVVEI